MALLKLKIGSPVSGANFFPRPDVIFRLRRALERDHVSFLAPRRTGKTSILIHLEESSAEGHPHFRVNLEVCTSPEQMVNELLKTVRDESSRWGKKSRGLWDKVVESLKCIDSISFVGAKLSFKGAEKDWQKPADALLEKLMEHDEPVTFLLDEFPILVDAAANEDRAGCEAMLRWFRDWRQRSADSQLRFLVTGSIGLANVVRKHGFSDSVNDFDSVELSPLSEGEVIKFVRALGEGIGLKLSEGNARKMLDLMGNSYPYFLQIFVAEVDDFCSSAGRVEEVEVTGEIIDSVYLNRIVTGPRNKYLPHMWDRLEKSFSQPEAKLARVLLKAVARADDGLTVEQLSLVARESMPEGVGADEVMFNNVLETLQHDAYLIQSSEAPCRIHFFSNLLHDYWKRRYA